MREGGVTREGGGRPAHAEGGWSCRCFDTHVGQQLLLERAKGTEAVLLLKAGRDVTAAAGGGRRETAEEIKQANAGFLKPVAPAVLQLAAWRDVSPL